MPLAAIASFYLAFLALARFEAFVVTALGIRATLDWSRGGAADGPGHSGPGAAALALLVIAAGVLWLLARHREGAHDGVVPLEVVMGFFFGACAVSVIGSAHLVTSLSELARLGGVVVMFFVLRRVLGSAPWWTDRVLTAVFASAIVPIIVGATQAARHRGLLHAGGFSRVRGTFVHPNPFAIYLTLVIIMGVALLQHVRGWRLVALIAILGGCSVSLLLTYTRTGWLAVVAGLVVVGVLQSRWLLAGLIAALVVLLVAVPSVSGRFSDLSREQHVSGTAGNSLVWRFDYWHDALELGKGRPITGIGLKMTESAEGRKPHNDFVRALAETGLVGFLAYLALIGAVLRTAWLAVRTARPGRDRGIAVGFAGCAAVFPLISFTSNVMSQAVILWYFFAFAAAAISVSRIAPD
ncbi:MAG: hypothetical protein QOK28_3651 [Actinomycetota bacterium]